MKFVTPFVLALVTAPMAGAQDLPPAIDAGQLGHSQVMSAAVRAQGERSYARRGGGATQRQLAACGQKARFRAEYGADHPKVQRLYSLCRGIGR